MNALAMNALVHEKQFDWEGLVAANEEVLEERIKFIQSNVSEARTELKEMGGQVIQLDSRVSRLDGKVEYLGEQVVRLDANVTKLDEKVNHLGEKVVQLDKHVVQLDARVCRLDDKVDTLGDRVGKVEERVGKLEDKVDKLAERFDRKTDELAERFDRKTDELSQRLDRKTDELAADNKEIRREMAQGFEKVHARIDRMSAELSTIRVTVNSTFRILSICASVITVVGVAIGIGKAFHWF